MSSSSDNHFPLLSLPAELLLQTLRYLPITTLLAVDATNHALHQLSLFGLTTLHLTSFPKRVHTTLTRLDINNDDIPTVDPGHTVHLELTPSTSPITSRRTSPSRPQTSSSRSGRSRTPPSDPKVLRQTVFDALNDLITTTLTTSPHLNSYSTLRNLTISAWSPSQSLLTHLSTSPQLTYLQHLTLNFHHATHHHPTFPSHFWSSPDAPSPIWNHISGLGQTHTSALRMRNLRSLTLARAGINSTQLRKWIESNPRISVLRLKMVHGMDEDFLNYLAERQIEAVSSSGTSTLAVPSVLRTLEIVNCAGLVLPLAPSTAGTSGTTDFRVDDTGYEPFTTLAPGAKGDGLWRLVIKSCSGINGPDVARRMAKLNGKLWHIEELCIDSGVGWWSLPRDAGVVAGAADTSAAPLSSVMSLTGLGLDGTIEVDESEDDYNLGWGSGSSSCGP